MSAIVRSLADLPHGCRVFIDTNVFDLHFRGKSVQCSALLGRVARREVIGYVNAQVLSDLIHKLMLAEAVVKGLISKMQASQLKQWLADHRTDAGLLTDYRDNFANVMGAGLKVLRVDTPLLAHSFGVREQWGLMTGDSLHISSMARTKPVIVDIASYDSDFEHIDALTVWRPNDVV